MADTLLEVKNLVVEYQTDDGIVQALNGVDIAIGVGKTLGLVGETGAGKTTLAKGIMRLIPNPPGKILDGQVLYNSRDILTMNSQELSEVRGKEISMIFQDPMTSLNPVMTIGEQIMEVIEHHNTGMSRSDAKKHAEEMLEQVGIPHDRFGEYPHQFSGGMKQRVVIAIALACNPKLLIADEPTTALDVTIQAQVLDMIHELKVKNNTAMILITHDLGVVAQHCDYVAIIYAGEVVEYGDLRQIYKETAHPYTEGLFGSIPSLTNNVKRLQAIDGMMPDPTRLPDGCKFCERCKYASDVCKHNNPQLQDLGGGHLVRCFRYAKEGGTLHAVDDVSFSIREGETLGVVGESGCGKSTMGRTILRLHEPTSGSVFFQDENIVSMSRRDFKNFRKDMQMIFQDPYASLNPRMTVSEAIVEPLVVQGLYKKKDKAGLDKEVARIMELVGLAKRLVNTYPHELDGGRRQRIGIARALALNPKFIVCDEPVSALDVSIQAQILNLMQDLQDELGLTYMFITHDLSVVKHFANDIMVMYLGQMVEKAPAKLLFQNPLHPYTKALLSAIPIPDPDYRMERIPMKGEITSPINPEPGCRFAKRCPYASAACEKEMTLKEMEPGHWVSCQMVQK